MLIEDGKAGLEQRGHVAVLLQPAAAEDQPVEPLRRLMRQRKADTATGRVSEHGGAFDAGRIEHGEAISRQLVNRAGRAAAIAGADATLIEAHDLEGARERRCIVVPERGATSEPADQQYGAALALRQRTQHGAIRQPHLEFAADRDSIGCVGRSRIGRIVLVPSRWCHGYLSSCAGRPAAGRLADCRGMKAGSFGAHANGALIWIIDVVRRCGPDTVPNGTVLLAACPAMPTSLAFPHATDRAAEAVLSSRLCSWQHWLRRRSAYWKRALLCAMCMAVRATGS
ncbi:hypothetical protein BOS5A_211103 [Bosea sp. EC-HK365B]|nr:hypothetical protein BOSE21B_50587 [Bosea sp. 21B]CAD5300769.1 hypothetical protein BOSE7B_90105 [Bosea sp. 7B]VVT60312.1 hypothetical protein BOS5A_211103 [Bosea sp. EC-HK365B]